MMSLAFGPTSCSSCLVPKSELLHSPAAQYGFVPKHSHHGGKHPALRAEKPYLTMRSFFSEAQRRDVFAFIDFKAWNAACGADAD